MGKWMSTKIEQLKTPFKFPLRYQVHMRTYFHNCHPAHLQTIGCKYSACRETISPCKEKERYLNGFIVFLSSELRTCERRPFDQSRVHAKEREGATLAPQMDPVHCDSNISDWQLRNCSRRTALRRMWGVEHSATPLAPYIKPLDEVVEPDLSYHCVDAEIAVMSQRHGCVTHLPALMLG